MSRASVIFLDVASSFPIRLLLLSLVQRSVAASGRANCSCIECLIETRFPELPLVQHLSQTNFVAPEAPFKIVPHAVEKIRTPNVLVAAMNYSD